MSYALPKNDVIFPLGAVVRAFLAGGGLIVRRSRLDWKPWFAINVPDVRPTVRS